MNTPIIGEKIITLSLLFLFPTLNTKNRKVIAKINSI